MQPSLAGLIPITSEPISTTSNDTFKAWYAVTRPVIARALAVTLGDAELAGEAADEAMARAYQSWAKIEHTDNRDGWAYRVALNWALSVFRRRRPVTRVHHVIASELPLPVDDSVRRALQSLDINPRTVVVCRYLLGWSEQQTADALQIRPGTVKSRLSRATVLLRDQLAHLLPESS